MDPSYLHLLGLAKRSDREDQEGEPGMHGRFAESLTG